MSSTPDSLFCGHCGDRLPLFGARLGFCGHCARDFPRAMARAGAALSAAGDAARDRLPRDKDPLLAALLSTLLPGGGQLYNGHFVKALLVFVLAPFVLPWLIGIADAWFSARKIHRQVAYDGLQPA